jgi:hypothetical protein
VRASKFAKGRQGTTRGQLEELVQENPEDVDARVKLGLACFKAGDMSSAVTHLGKAVEVLFVGGKDDLAVRAPMTAEAFRSLGKAHFETFRTRAHFDHEVLAKSFEAYKVALADADASKNKGMLLEVANVYKCYGSLDGAMQVLGTIAQSGLDYDRIGTVFLSTSGVWLAKGEWENAEKTLRLAGQSPPKGFKAWHMLFLVARITEAAAAAKTGAKEPKTKKKKSKKGKNSKAKGQVTGGDGKGRGTPVKEPSLYRKAFLSFLQSGAKKKTKLTAKQQSNAELAKWINGPAVWAAVARACDAHFLIFWSHNLLSRALAIAGPARFREWWPLARACYACQQKDDAISAAERAVQMRPRAFPLRCALHQWKGIPAPEPPKPAPTPKPADGGDRASASTKDNGAKSSNDDAPTPVKLNIKQRQALERAAAKKAAEEAALAKKKKLEEIAAATRAAAEREAMSEAAKRAAAEAAKPRELTEEEKDLLDPSIPPESEPEERARFLAYKRRKRAKAKAEFEGAQKLQAIARGRVGRRIGAAKKREKRWQCAIKCQAQYRGILARRRVSQMIEDLDNPYAELEAMEALATRRPPPGHAQPSARRVAAPAPAPASQGYYAQGQGQSYAQVQPQHGYAQQQQYAQQHQQQYAQHQQAQPYAQPQYAQQHQQNGGYYDANGQWIDGAGNGAQGGGQAQGYWDASGQWVEAHAQSQW